MTLLGFPREATYPGAKNKHKRCVLPYVDNYFLDIINIMLGGVQRAGSCLGGVIKVE